MSKKSDTKIITCTCTNKGQDELHGKGRRVANYTKGKRAPAGGYRCTVCSRVTDDSRPGF